jgi:hypothetical protein
MVVARRLDAPVGVVPVASKHALERAGQSGVAVLIANGILREMHTTEPPLTSARYVRNLLASVSAIVCLLTPALQYAQHDP